MEEKWEYVIAEYSSNAGTDNINTHMNIWGKQGWELVSVDNNKAYFKRRILDIRTEKKLVDNGLGEHGLW